MRCPARPGSWLPLLAALACACGGAQAGVAAPTLEAEPLGLLSAGLDELPRVDKWKDEERRCKRAGRRRYCDGPRRVPAPVGFAGRLARELGLGTYGAAADLIRREPRPEWLLAVRKLGLAPPEQTLIWPVDEGWLGRGYGYTREDNRRLRHRGIDVTCEAGAKVRAVAEGLVGYADNGIDGYGNMLTLLHADGSVSMYAHLSAIHVFPGQVVPAGQVVAEAGMTGLARGAHLHMEWRQGGEEADPMPRFPAERQRRGPPAE